MPTKRQLRFLDKVAEAARSAPRPRGRPTPENLTDEGRRMGLKAIQQAPRCQAMTKRGTKCRCAAVRGATRCIKHGGRVEVPHHPHNIRRFLNGEMHAEYARQDRFNEGRQAWEAMDRKKQRELLDALPDALAQDTRRLYEAARVWQADILPGSVWRKRWRQVLGAHLNA